MAMADLWLAIREEEESVGSNHGGRVFVARDSLGARGNHEAAILFVVLADLRPGKKASRDLRLS